MVASMFDLRKQLTFYGSYHSNPINILIHIICVPVIVWTALAFASRVPVPSFLSDQTYMINEYLRFEPGFASFLTGAYLAYYFALDSVAALLYCPQMILSLLTATALAHRQEYMNHAIVLHVLAWIAQFLGHGLAEKRAPALLDNLLGAVVLAPFFVHLEILFMLGYRPALQKDLKNDIGKEIARIRKLEADKKRAHSNENQ